MHQPGSTLQQKLSLHSVVDRAKDSLPAIMDTRLLAKSCPMRHNPFREDEITGYASAQACAKE